MSEQKDNWDPKLLPIMKCVFGKKGIEQRNASEVDKAKVDFFRGKDFTEFMLKHDAVLKRHCQQALDLYTDGRVPADDEDVEKIGSALLEKGFIAKANHRPLVDGADESGKKKKWPERLVRKDTKVFDTQGFYIVLYEGSQTWRHLMLAFVVFCIIAGCLFPVWPPWARIAAWYFGLGFITLWIMLEFTRLGSFCAGWLVGVEFWILPNFNDEYCGLVVSFKPAYSFERRRDGMMMLLTRLVVFAVAALAVEEASKTHSISDIKDFVTGSYQDIINWGESKALMLEGAQQKMALPNLADLEREEEEERLKESEGLGGDGEDSEKIIPGMPRTGAEAPEEGGAFDEEGAEKESGDL